ncbi:hypothetical protein [Tahibacter amnicola]|uniref:Cytochrome c domain-containing protein n=1 Tax=Tahibacter amnicola TaxID=2976241 RepID=A0ABY6BP26_9GAMM|nr:hypothetical protein [Tahibacter amnicola]UXI70150.1 hypothetical protein N4264_11115 [Tahibacter amnicola]
MNRIKPSLAAGVSLAFVSCFASAQIIDPALAGNASELSSERRGLAVAPAPLSAATASEAIAATDPRRSFAVTDKAILAQFTFKETMETIVMRGGLDRSRALPLFRQWWDTQNRKPGIGPGSHCDDQILQGQTTFNGFKYECPRGEGALAQSNPFIFGPDSFEPVGLFNRFDLAPADGADCGEYRIVFAKGSGQVNFADRNLVIFEATLPNPRPQAGLDGCVRVAEFWDKLSRTNNVSQRASQLKQFYFTGLPGFRPVVHPDNYGAGPSGKGQIRSNQFMTFQSGGNWVLREFKLFRGDSNLVPCPADRPCPLAGMRPQTVKTNPSATLFSDNTETARTFRTHFVNQQVANLAVPDINRFTFTPPKFFNTGESQEQGTDNDYVFAFSNSPPSFRVQIQNKLNQIGSRLTPDQIIARAQAMSCAGCHQLSGFADIGGGQPNWPGTLGFVHVTEQFTETGPDGERFPISQALTDVFLPHRQNVLRDYLNSRASLPRCDVPCKDSAGRPQVCSEICRP